MGVPPDAADEDPSKAHEALPEEPVSSDVEVSSRRAVQEDSDVVTLGEGEQPSVGFGGEPADLYLARARASGAPSSLAVMPRASSSSWSPGAERDGRNFACSTVIKQRVQVGIAPLPRMRRLGTRTPPSWASDSRISARACIGCPGKWSTKTSSARETHFTPLASSGGLQRRDPIEEEVPHARNPARARISTWPLSF